MVAGSHRAGERTQAASQRRDSSGRVADGQEREAQGVGGRADAGLVTAAVREVDSLPQQNKRVVGVPVAEQGRALVPRRGSGLSGIARGEEQAAGAPPRVIRPGRSPSSWRTRPRL